MIKSNTIIGKVLWWDARDKEGIILDARGNEYYFNYSVLSNQAKTKNLEGNLVEFTKNKDVKHISCASEVIFTYMFELGDMNE